MKTLNIMGEEVTIEILQDVIRRRTHIHIQSMIDHKKQIFISFIDATHSDKTVVTEAVDAWLRKYYVMTDFTCRNKIIKKVSKNGIS